MNELVQVAKEVALKWIDLQYFIAISDHVMGFIAFFFFGGCLIYLIKRCRE